MWFRCCFKAAFVPMFVVSGLDLDSAKHPTSGSLLLTMAGAKKPARTSACILMTCNLSHCWESRIFMKRPASGERQSYEIKRGWLKSVFLWSVSVGMRMVMLWFDGCQMESDEVLSHSGACHHGSPVKSVSTTERQRLEGGVRVREVMDEDGAREGRGMK